jgi:hypothetical protein
MGTWYRQVVFIFLMFPGARFLILDSVGKDSRCCFWELEGFGAAVPMG